MSKTILVTVSDDRFGRKEGAYKATQQTISNIFEVENKYFGVELSQWDWDKIKLAPFYKSNKTLLDNIDPARNGRAYKPLVIQQELNNLEFGDFLIYNDCSPELWHNDSGPIPKEEYDIEVLHRLVKNNGGILTAFVKWDYKNKLTNGLGIHTHDNFTLNRCIERMQMEAHRYDYQHASGFMAFEKNEKTVEFVKTWAYWNCIDDCASMGRMSLPNDYSYWEAEHERKMGHRHDQSISGLLLNKMGANLIDLPSIWKVNPYNFVNFCRLNQEYNFISSNNKHITGPNEIKKGSKVINSKGVHLKVFEFAPADGIEWIVVGINRSSCYKTTKEHLTLMEQ